MQKRIKMKSNEKIIRTFVLIALGAAFLSLEKASWAMNMFLLPAIAFTFTGSMVFLIHEKQIIKEFTSTYKEGFKAAIVSALLFYSAYLTIHILSASAGFMILLSSYSAYKILKRKNKYFLLAFSILSLILIFFIPSYHEIMIVKILLIASAFLGETVLMFMLKEVKSQFIEKPKTTYCYANILIALISVALFFITKSDTAAVLSKMEQMHLFILTFISTFLVSLVLIIKPESAGIGKISLAVSATAVTIILSLFNFSFFFIGAFLLFLIPLFFSKKTHKGFAITEFLAMITLIAIVVSLLFPVYVKLRSEIIVNSDKSLFLSGKTDKIENAVKYGDYFIKYIDSKPKFVYLAKEGSFRSFSIE